MRKISKVKYSENRGETEIVESIYISLLHTTTYPTDLQLSSFIPAIFVWQAENKFFVLTR